MSIDPKAAWVSVILREIGVPIDVSTKQSRIAMQKGIYLAQTTGADLSYRFSWYLNGPYSTSLAGAYYKIDENPALYEGYSADANFREQLAPARNLVAAKPPAANLSDWLEAVGSLDFMIRVMGRSVEKAVARCKELKPRLEPLFDPALGALQANGFLS